MTNPTTAAPAPAEPFPIWTVWREEQPAYGYFATEDIAKRASIDCWEEDEPACPDYSWRPDGGPGGWELLVGGERAEVYIRRHLVWGGLPQPPRAAVLTEAADAPAAECSAQHRQFDDGRLCIRAAQHRGDHIDERGFHWSDTVAVYPVGDGTFRTGTNRSALLRRLAGEAAPDNTEAPSAEPEGDRDASRPECPGCRRKVSGSS